MTRNEAIEAALRRANGLISATLVDLKSVDRPSNLAWNIMREMDDALALPPDTHTGALRAEAAEQALAAMTKERDEVYQKLDDDRKFLQDRAHDYCVRMEKAKAQLAASLAREEEKDRALKAVQWSCDNGEDEVCCPECGAFRYERKHRPTCIIGAITPPTKSPEKEAGL